MGFGGSIITLDSAGDMTSRGVVVGCGAGSYITFDVSQTLHVCHICLH